MSLTPAQRVAVRDRTRLLGFPRSGRRAIVVGGGPTAARRAAALTRSALPVTVFAPSLCDDVFDLLAERLVTWENRWPTPTDLGDAWLVHAATGDPELDARVCSWAASLRASA
ncbi:NAD(P)-dependent oxidoreductase [Oryzobacter sp. R7]|uniref:NAD(P)-dependent oxidoreductase n=1 Tax=Oryzobacter faecalis TaxID=3388656 RepID=UPI00398CBF5E